MKTLRRRGSLPLDERLHSLARVVQLAEGRLPEDDVRPARDLVERAGRRLDLGLAHTVIALAGATGSGKSSIFNALAGRELSTVGVRRPTTGVAQACVWGASEGDELLEWLAIPRRHRMDGGDEGLDGLVLLDLPDHDSTEVAHRLEVDRLAGVVDLLVWVLDPQKYADAALHYRYIRAMAPHESVTLFVLNQSDRLRGDELNACIADLRRVLRDDGLRDPDILATSAVTGDGMNVLRSEIATRVSERKAALHRLSADLEVAAERLAPFCASGGGSAGNTSGERARLVDALADAAGARVVSEAVARSHMRESRLATGWPVTRWLARVRPDPLRRMHLGAGTEDATSVPDASAAQQAEVALCLNALSDRASRGLPRPWPSLMRSVTVDRQDGVQSELRREIGANALVLGQNAGVVHGGRMVAADPHPHRSSGGSVVAAVVGHRVAEPARSTDLRDRAHPRTHRALDRRLARAGYWRRSSVDPSRGSERTGAVARS